MSGQGAGTAPAERVAFCSECGEELAGGSELQQLARAHLACLPDAKVRGFALRYNQAALMFLRARDREIAVARLGAAKRAADGALEAAREALPPLEAALRDAVSAERDAEDRARSAAEHARKCSEAERIAQRDGASAERMTEALMRSRAAADVERRASAALEGTSAARSAAEAALAGRQAEVSALEDVAAAARVAAANVPALVPLSYDATAHAHWEALACEPDFADVTENDWALAGLMGQAEVLAQVSGLAAMLERDGRKKEREEAEAKRREQLARRPGLPPGTMVAMPMGAG